MTIVDQDYPACFKFIKLFFFEWYKLDHEIDWVLKAARRMDFISRRQSFQTAVGGGSAIWWKLPKNSVFILIFNHGQMFGYWSLSNFFVVNNIIFGKVRKIQIWFLLAKKTQRVVPTISLMTCIGRKGQNLTIIRLATNFFKELLTTKNI